MTLLRSLLMTGDEAVPHLLGSDFKPFSGLVDPPLIGVAVAVSRSQCVGGVSVSGVSADTETWRD